MQKIQNAENMWIGWVAEASMGKRDAFGRLYRQFSTAMYNICVRMVGEKNLADDILQESFIAAFNNIKSLREPTRFGGWLKQITIRKCIQHSSSHHHFSELNGQEYWPDETESHWWEDLSMADIQAAIKELPDGCREIFNLFAVEDYTHKDIAELLHISESTSKSQYHRAKGLLRVKLLKVLKTNG